MFRPIGRKCRRWVAISCEGKRKYDKQTPTTKLINKQQQQQQQHQHQQQQQRQPQRRRVPRTDNNKHSNNNKNINDNRVWCQGCSWRELYMFTSVSNCEGNTNRWLLDVPAMICLCKVSVFIARMVHGTEILKGGYTIHQWKSRFPIIVLLLNM